MEDIKVLEMCIHNIEENVEEILVEKNQALEYLKTIINKSVENKNIRYFKKKRESTEVISCINNLVLDKLKSIDSEVASTLQEGTNTAFKNEALKIAKRLLEQQNEAQKKVLKIGTKISQGSLIQSIIKNEDNLGYILAKIEHVNILDKKDWEKHTGLPLEKEILKTCLINYNFNGEVEEIRIFDSNNLISDYWKNGFLELEPCTNNEDNTKKSLNTIDRFLVRNIKSKSPKDYIGLFNSLIGYYNQNKGFDYDNLIEKVFLNYTPYDSEKIDIKVLESKLKKLPDNNLILS